MAGSTPPREGLEPHAVDLERRTGSSSPERERERESCFARLTARAFHPEMLGDRAEEKSKRKGRGFPAIVPPPAPSPRCADTEFHVCVARASSHQRKVYLHRERARTIHVSGCFPFDGRLNDETTERMERMERRELRSRYSRRGKRGKRATHRNLGFGFP